MFSIFVSFCFIKTISGGDKYVSGTGLYRISNGVDAFREITFKGFTGNAESLVTPLEKNSIALVALIQTIPVSFSDAECVLTSTTGSYGPDNEGGKESFVLTRRLYNGVTNNKHVPSNADIVQLKIIYKKLFCQSLEVRLSEHSSETNNSNPVPETTEQINLSNTGTSSVSSSDTRTDASTSANSSEPVINASADLPLSQNKNAKHAKKGLRPQKK
ncbi:hypothetical protein F8M41_019655 [Gigaspora margarita]|uniref:Uncharacterized protein n=1 Tax=Gigaspora margarita TaxID=4874 RepID=A0A8H4AJP9_GIGMA|nr:hypothetical protein F8M41_019655 [Gigaspora margarita]